MGIANYNAESIINAINTNTERKAYFEGCGINVQNAHSLETAIKMAKMDWEVVKMQMAFIKQVPQTLADGTQILVDVPQVFKNNFVTVRSDTMEPLGTVKKNYQVLQNRESYDFLDSLVATGDAKFETAGVYGKTGAKTFISMSTEPLEILGDEFVPYILFLNSFDGSGAVQAMFTPIRTWCSNTLARAKREAVNRITIRHSNSMKVQLEIAKEILLKNTKYLEALKKEAEKLAVTPFSQEAFEAFVKEQFPVNTEDSNIIQVRNMEQIARLLKAYKEDDLTDFAGTAWRAVQAMSDFESHKPVFRQTEGAQFANMKTVIDMMPLTNLLADRILQAA